MHPLLVLPISTSPEVCYMSHGHPRLPILGIPRPAMLGPSGAPVLGPPHTPVLGPAHAPVLGPSPIPGESWRQGQEPPRAGLPEWLSPGAGPAGAVLPTARWVCRQIDSGRLEMGLAARAAREFTGQILRGWGLLVLADDAAVIVSELVTNALMHGGGDGAARGDVELILWRRSGQVLCAVTDPGTGAPVLVQPDPFGEAGRGLYVVQALSATWGWTRLGDRRKAVWAAMGVPGADAGQTPSQSG
jgi:anti-sigma regulatory factor (Ser/Thr protein kinase)